MVKASSPAAAHRPADYQQALLGEHLTAVGSLGIDKAALFDERRLPAACPTKPRRSVSHPPGIMGDDLP